MHIPVQFSQLKSEDKNHKRGMMLLWYFYAEPPFSLMTTYVHKSYSDMHDDVRM